MFHFIGLAISKKSPFIQLREFFTFVHEIKFTSRNVEISILI